MTHYVINDESCDYSFFVINDKEEFYLHYPKPLYGEYRPQPFTVPEKYPVLVINGNLEYNPNGPDTIHLIYIYDFTNLEE